MTVTAADIKTRFPEFGALDSATITRWLDEAGRNHNACQWGGRSDDGLSWLTAHFLVLYGEPCSSADAAPGPITSSREGQVAATWTVPMMFQKDDLGTTKYGRRYLSILHRLQTKRCT